MHLTSHESGFALHVFSKGWAYLTTCCQTKLASCRVFSHMRSKDAAQDSIAYRSITQTNAHSYYVTCQGSLHHRFTTNGAAHETGRKYPSYTWITIRTCENASASNTRAYWRSNHMWQNVMHTYILLDQRWHSPDGVVGALWNIILDASSTSVAEMGCLSCRSSSVPLLPLANCSWYLVVNAAAASCFPGKERGRAAAVFWAKRGGVGLLWVWYFFLFILAKRGGVPLD